MRLDSLLTLILSVLSLQTCVRADADAGASVAAEKLFSLKDVTISIANPDGSVEFSDSAAYPKVVLSNTGLEKQQNLEVSLSVLAGNVEFKPKQVMLMVKPLSSPVAAYAVGKNKKGGSFALSIGASSLDKQNVKQGGICEVTLLVGDDSIERSLSWYLGTIDLPALAATSTSPPTKTATSQVVSNVKPVIEHIHRPPTKQPPALVSVVFAALSIVPLLVAVGLAFAAGANFKGLPKDATALMYVVAFHASLAALLVLYLIFWIGLNLMQTLPLALGLGLVVALTGYKALSALASIRLKKD